MNLYLRYFDDETVVSSVDEAVAFLKSLKMDDFDIDDEFIASLKEFVESPVSFPKRYKVRAHYYFIVIKTNANSLEEFKRNNVKSILEADDQQGVPSVKRVSKDMQLNQETKGWYDGQLNFKRVICVPSTGKFQYKDTAFRALVKADSAVHCYERIVGYLKGRPDIDHRSQYPSPKGKNFQCAYIGETRPTDIDV